MAFSAAFFRDRYTRLELIFFLIYFLLFPILSGMEYYMYESPPFQANWMQDLPEHLLYGFSALFPAWICYYYVIKRFLFEKRYLLFACTLILYLVLHQGYKLVIYWLIAQLHFLPSRIVTDAGRWYANNTILHFFSIYELRDLMVLSALAYFIRSAKLDKQLSQLRQQRLESELNYLKVQIHPHFFFNTLNNIYTLTLLGSDKAAPLVARHADTMRYILYESSKQHVSLQQEIDFLRNFVDVESMHFSPGMDIRFETQGIDEQVPIEPLVLLPFIENAFKHGLRQETLNGYIYILICLFDGELVAEIRNSKPVQGVRLNGQGIGLQNASKRLEILYPGRHQINIKEDAGSYEIRVNLRLKNR